MFKNVASFLFVSLVLFLTLPAPLLRVQAQELKERSAIELQIGPTKSKLSLAAEASVSGTFKVRNLGANEFDYQVYVRPYWVIDEKYNADYDTERDWTQMARWVSVDQESGHLAVDEIQEIHYTVNVPADVPDGGQYAVIFVEAGLDLEPNATGITTRQRLGHLLYGRLIGHTREEGKLVEQEIRGHWHWQPPIQVTSLVENTGNVDFDANYRLRAVNLFGKLRQEITYVNVVLPTTQRLVTLELDDLAPLGIYKVTQEVEVLGVSESVEAMVWVMSPFILTIIAGLLALEGVYVVIKKMCRSGKKKKRAE